MTDLGLDTTPAEVRFIRAELLTGLTFATIARAANYQAKIDRNRMNARKAYDVLLRFIPTTRLSASDADEVESKLAELKIYLQHLGEDI
jgi:hypothetical protein